MAHVDLDAALQALAQIDLSVYGTESKRNF